MCKSIGKESMERKEVSLSEILSQFLEDEDVHDVTLKGCDGIGVTANKYVLAVRSPVFKAMLLGKFSESTKREVEIREYSGSVLRAVVEYIHTDKPQILNPRERMTADESQNTSTDYESLQTIVSLAAAANFFDLPGLAGKVMDFVEKQVRWSKTGSLSLLECCNQAGASVPSELKDLAWSQFRSLYVKFDGNSPAVAALGQNTLEEILKDQDMEMTEHLLFTLLVAWTESHPLDRKPVARQLINHIQLEKISPDHLSSCVEPSGLATPEQLWKAYKSHSMATRHHLPAERGRRHALLPVWSNTSSHLCKSDNVGKPGYGLLQCGPIASGVHQWTLEVVGRPDSLLYGIVSAGAIMEEGEWISRQSGCWGFEINGSVVCNGNKVNDTEFWALDCGEEVTLTLDLRPGQEGYGTLGAEIKKKNGQVVKIEPITGLLGHDSIGFLPAVEVLTQEAGFRLIRFKELHGGILV